MIDPTWCRTMAAYNGEMNRRIYGSAAALAEEARREDLGAFFGSLHATLSHILWADTMWMCRFDGWEKPAVGISGSTGFAPEWEGMTAARADADARIEAWTGGLSTAWLAEELVWFSGATQREMRQPKWLLVTHMFNHQTHHRGQAHALLTRLGVKTADTDLPWVVEVQTLGL